VKAPEKAPAKHSPKQIVALVILVLMAMVTSFVEFPLIPSAPWLQYDPSGIIVLLAGLLYSPWIGSAVAVLAWIPHLVTNPLGAFMNIMASLSMVVVMGLVYHARPSLKRAVLGVCAGVVAAVAVSICLNFVVTPLYLSSTYEEVAALVLPALLPFNALKAAVNGTVALVAYRKLAALLSEE
jgi:riboflavin transporter FmnP